MIQSSCSVKNGKLNETIEVSALWSIELLSSPVPLDAVLRTGALSAFNSVNSRGDSLKAQNVRGPGRVLYRRSARRSNRRSQGNVSLLV